MFKRLTISKTVGWRVVACLFLTAGALSQQHENVAPRSDSPQEHFQSAQTFQIAGEYEKAAAEYREAIARGLDQLGNLRISREDYAGGTDLLAKAARVMPDFVEARVDLGIAKFKAGDFEAAKSEIEAALQQDHHNVRALNLIGKIYFLRGDYQAAADSLQAALQLEPDFDIGYTLALADLELKKPAPAGIIFDEMLASSKPTAGLQALIGIAYRETGYLEQAISHLNKSIALDPKNPRAHTALGLAYFLSGKDGYIRAREEFLAAIAITPGDYTDGYYLGMIAADQKNFAEATKRFQQAASAHPSDPDVYLRLAQTQFDAGHFEQTLAALHKSLDLSSLDQDAQGAAFIHELMGKALEGLGRRPEAEAETAQARLLRAQTHPDSAQPHDRHSAEMGRSGQQELRSMLLQAPRGPAPSNLEEDEFVKRVSVLLGAAYDNWGVIDARAGRYANATAEFAQAAHWNSGTQDVDRKWGMAAFRASQYDQAIPPLERQIHRTPGDLALRETLGVCYFMSDRFSEAAAMFLPALDKLSSNPGVLYAAGVSFARSGSSKDASAVFSRMLKENPNIPQVHLLLGEAHADLAEYPDALAEFSRALELDPKLAEAHYYRGVVRFKHGKMDDAAQEFIAELEVNPQSSAATYQLAVVRLAQQQPDEAIRLLTQVLAQSPDNSDARYQLGKAMLEKGNVKAAIENLEAAVHAQPKDYSYYQLSLAYQRDGRMQEAQLALQMYENLKRKPPPARKSEQ